MNTGVEILLQRMKDNPEDFFYPHQHGGMSRWMRLVDNGFGEDIFTEEESNAVKNGLKEVRRIHFTEMVMKALAGEDETSDKGKTSIFSGQQSAIGVGGTIGISPYSNTATINASSLTLGKTHLKEAELKAMMAELKIRENAREAREQERERKSKTLYGKLKNYLYNE